jgi:TonB-dependent receptor
MKIQRTIGSLLLGAPFIGAPLLVFAPAVLAQSQSDDVIEEVIVTGIRGSLASSIDQRRRSDNLVEIIVAEDIGKLPDQNLAEVLENVPGVQITRTAGVGTGVQIRGTNANRTEINGVSTVGSGSGRSGINFEDISAGIIAGLEVTKAPESKTIEGSVGGTINLKTIRPLDLSEQLGFVRLQVEDSSLNVEDEVQPRIAGAWGNNWSTGSGDWGVVLAGTYSEQAVTAFRPRTDRDNLVSADSGEPAAQDFDFLPIQFFIQDYDRFEYETINFAGTLEYRPNDAVGFYFDTILSDQTREQRSSRIQASGISGLRNTAVPDSFETINFGSLSGSNGVQNLGSIQAALTGVIPLDSDGSDGNLRYSGDTNTRESESQIFTLGANWQITDRLWSRFEASTSSNDTTTPFFNTTLNFINPNSPLNYDALLANHIANEANGNDDLYAANENGTPFVYDLTGGALTWGVAQNATAGPTTAQLLDPMNVVLRDVNQSRDIAENSENAFRADFELTLDSFGLTSFDFGYRYNDTSSLRDQRRDNLGLRNIADAPRGNLFAELLVPGPNNFNSADGRELYVSDFLLIDQQAVSSDPDRVLSILNGAIEANNAITGSDQGPIEQPTSSLSAFFDISEETHALYAQLNFAAGIFRGNFGLRYLETEVESIGNTVIDGEPTPTSTKGSYDFVLPRLNVVADITENVLLRFGYGEDIRRPNFDTLSTSFTFSTSPNPPTFIGNPGLNPEEVASIDLGVEWYFAEASVLSVGFFHKERTGLFVRTQEDPFEDPVTGFRDITPPCEQGGIFNPIADINVFGPPGVGVCVPLASTINGSGETTQTGIEVVFQYDLSGYEDALGWASGFGFIANYTAQEFDGPDEYWTATSRASDVFASNGATDVDLQTELIDLSESSYNITLYYEKYGLSARARYTWREAYRSTDFGSTSSFPWGFPVVQDDRAQLNASVNYIFNDHLTVGIEGINLTESDVTQYCVNQNALLCYQGLTDRRITLGASYRF